MMPVMDGCELVRMMQANPEMALTPVLMISALPEAVVRMKCEPMGAFLHKPFSSEQLLRQVRDLLAAVEDEVTLTVTRDGCASESDFHPD